LLNKPKTLCTKLSGACQVYCCFNLACDVTDFEAYDNSMTIHRPLTKGRITQQSSPERDEGNAFSKNVFLASKEGSKLGTQPKFELSWQNGKILGPQFLLHTL
jgi:hypothetical protein